jgi:hypothetical protein
MTVRRSNRCPDALMKLTNEVQIFRSRKRTKRYAKPHSADDIYRSGPADVLTCIVAMFHNVAGKCQRYSALQFLHRQQT